MKTFELTDDAKTILMLTARLANSDDSGIGRPLTPAEYNKLAAWLEDQKLRPADLLRDKERYESTDRVGNTIDYERIKRLLSRGAALAFAIEKWMNKGIWILSLSDPNYPARFRDRLINHAPPILFGTGDASLMNLGGLAIVGSRNVDSEGETFTSDIGTACANLNFQVVTGGARGVDQLALRNSLENNGSAVAALADSLMKWSASTIARQAIREGRLALVSPFNPEAPFNVGNAMQRNKLIYALADYALVVSADFERGGTWAGAAEELKRVNHIPVFVREGENVPRGNIELMKRGALSFPGRPWGDDLRHILKKSARQDNPRFGQLSLINPAQNELTPDSRSDG